LSCASTKRTANTKLCRAPPQNARQTQNFAMRFAKAHDKEFFHNYTLFIKVINTSLKNFRKLKQNNLCCLLLIENKFEVKTQFEYIT
jgi:hypothetical protein